MRNTLQFLTMFRFYLNSSASILGLSLLLILFGQQTAPAQTPGSLDSSFGSGGIVTTSINTRDNAYAVAVQADGKIVTAGITFNGTNTDFALLRYNTDGSLDTSFDGDGKVTTDFGNSQDDAFDVAIQTDGKIIAVGTTFNSLTGTGDDFAIARYNINGSLDTSFDGDGKVTTTIIGTSSDEVRAVAIQADGKIVVAGQSIGGFAVVRYNPNGSLDASFDGDGKVTTSISMRLDEAFAVAIQTDGKIVAAGSSRIDSDNAAFALVRYNPNGSLDTSFDTDGKVTTDFGSLYDETHDIAIQADGKIIAAGYTEISGGSQFALARYNVDGSLDASFDGDGKAITPFGIDGGATDVAIQSNGKIVAAGVTFNGTKADFALIRYNSNGSLDTTFNGTGKVQTSLGNNSAAYAVAIQSDGKIVAAGFRANEPVNGLISSDFAVVRYIGDAVKARQTLFDFDGDSKADVSVYRPSNGVWYLLNSQTGFSAVQFGISTDQIVPADYDGDGKTDIAVWRDGTWYLQRSSSGFTSIPFGSPGDIPMPADFDGDGKAELVVFRPSNGVWYSLNLAGNAISAVQFGSAEDKPVAADFDGDGRVDQAVFRPSNGVWYMLRSRDGFGTVQFGISSDRPVVGDYDGDGSADQAVFRPSNGTWYILGSRQGFTAIQFGIPTDIPTPGDYDGDGKTDIAVFRPEVGTWYQMKSNQGFGAVQFGTNGDKPIPSAFVP
jgi:uncharacterized delta-60 repeat protein